MKLKSTLLILLLAALLPTALAAQEEIRFSGNHTRASMRGESKSLILSGDAWVETGATRIEADEIELFGENSRYLSCSGSVVITDDEQGLTLTTNSLLFDRISGILKIDGWAEMEDLENGIIARGSYLENSRESGITLIQISVRIFKDTDEGPMVSMTDSAIYNSSEQTLEMTGDSSVFWNGNTYQAARITIDLGSNEITMEGSVRGTINE